MLAAFTTRAGTMLRRDAYSGSAVTIKALVRAFFTIALSSSTLLAIAHAATAQVVAITLRDASVDPSNSGMAIKTDTAKVRAGRVALEAVNLSNDLVHEVLVVPALSDGKELPYDIKTNMVVEKRVHSLGVGSSYSR
jgi:uncharacterized cupredoxin-like copper-binding protein